MAETGWRHPGRFESSFSTRRPKGFPQGWQPRSGASASRFTKSGAPTSAQLLITPFDAEPYEALNLGILLTEPPREAAEFQERSDILELLRSFYEEAPEEMRPSMWTFLTEDALHAWRRRAHCVFERS